MQNKKYINNIGILLKLCKRLEDNNREGMLCLLWKRVYQCRS